MAYQGKLQSGQTFILEHQGEQTVIRLSSGGQHQSSSVSTGPWTQPPKVFQTDSGAVIKFTTNNGPVFYSVKSGQLASLDSQPDLASAETVDLTEVEDGTGKGEMKPMEPMKSMKPL